jgi:hypothetical protein
VPVAANAKGIRGDEWRSFFDRKSSRGRRITVPNIVPLPLTAVDHLISICIIDQSAGSPWAPKLLLISGYNGMIPMSIDVLELANTLQNQQVSLDNASINPAAAWF